MSVYLTKFGCPDNFTNDWKKLHATKLILLFAGMAMAASGYYIGSSLMIFDRGQQMWMICALFWGSAGVCIVAYSIALIYPEKKLVFTNRIKVHKSVKDERKLKAFSGTNFHNEDNGICTQRNRSISELLSTQCYKRKSLSLGLNNNVAVKGKFIGSNGAAKGMNGSYETLYKAETLNTSKGIERKVFNELPKSLSYKEQNGNCHQFTKSINAAETFGSLKIANYLEESSFSEFTKGEDQTSRFRNEIGFEDTSNNINSVFKHQLEKSIDENIEINDCFQLSPSSFSKFPEDPYFCKALCEGEAMELATESSVSDEQSKRFKIEIYPVEFISLAKLLLTDDLTSNIQLSHGKFLKTEDSETVTDDVKDSNMRFWSKIPMKRSSSKFTKKRCEPIILKNYETVLKNEPDNHFLYEASSALISASSGSDSILTDSKTYTASEIDLSASTFMEKLPLILIGNMFNPERLAQCETNFHSCYAA